MKWFAKYWIIKKKYDRLMERYKELYKMVDPDFWKKEDIYDRYCIDVFVPTR